MNLDKLIRKNVQQLVGYSSARDDFKSRAEVYLDANENPFENGVNRYPDPYQNKLKQKIAEIKGVDKNQLLIGNGSDEVLDLILRAFCEPKTDNIILNSPTYGMYKVLAQINNITCKEILLNENFTLNIKEILKNVTNKTKIIFICSPNNPTGNSIPAAQIMQLLKNVICLVVIDEAYIDFSNQESMIKELKNYENLIICQTLSKAWAMASLRLGIGIASPKIINVLNKIKPPYNINKLSQLKALELLNDIENFNNQKGLIQIEKEKLKTALLKLSIVKKIYPSDANFWLIKVTDATAIYNWLLKDQIVVRNRSNEPLCNNCIRITVGTPKENIKIIKALNKIENEKSIIYR